MENAMIKPLQIISASAGSGKTYKLVLTYLELLLESSKADPFAHIVAMTFTNKAALEMKTRIIEALEILSFPQQFKREERKYENVLCEKTKCSPEQLAAKSKIILQKILHRYEDFKVLTIDKFNLRLIRSFSRELDLPADFEVIIDEDEVLEKVVDQLLAEIGNAENETLTKLVLGYAKSQLEEGEKWNFRSDLIKFIALIKSEKEQKTVDQLMLIEFSEGNFHQYREALKKAEKAFVAIISGFKDFLNSIDFWGIANSDIAGGKTTVTQVKKFLLLTEPIYGFMTEPTIKNLCEGNKTNEPVAGMETKLKEIEPLYFEHFKNFTLLNSIRKNYHNMWLLKILARRLEKMRQDESLIRISEFNQLIGKLVQNEDAPFLYERLGNRYEHYLLDEFQDTSRMQWLNLIPLVHEGISKLGLNFIVGDPKQSIYRFKNGLAEQFVVLPEIYNPESDLNLAQKSHYFKSLGEKNVIKQNWRSTKTIVDFNNKIFTAWSKNLPATTLSFFKDVEQESVSDKIGYICFQHIENDKDKVASQNTVPQIISWIEEAIADGFKPNDITILGRGNRDCNEWSVALTERGYKVVSSDSLFVDSDLYVQWIISYLQKRRSPSVESITKKFISMTLMVKNLSLSIYEEYFIPIEGTKYKRIDENKFITDFYSSNDDFYIPYESIYDIITKFCTLVKIDVLKNHYAHHLLDMAFQFDLRFGPDLQLFLEQYLSKGKRSSVQLPESEDALTVMTIHKSKGLEFPIVILPKISMTKEKNDKIKYFIPSEGQIVQLSRKQVESIPEYARLAAEEAEQIITDNTNLYYVAFTRPKTRLYARNIYKKGSQEEKLSEACIHNFTESWSEETHELIIGERLEKRIAANASKIENTNFNPISLQDFLWFPNIAIENNNPFDEDFTMSEAQLFGTQFHLLLSEVDHKNQIEEKLNELIATGDIDRQYKEKLKEQSHDIFEKYLTSLYESSTKILSEQSILFAEEKSSRPDKILIQENQIVVIDFKTGNLEKKHEKQVKNYGQLLTRIGYTNVKCALLYTEISDFVWVE